MAAVLRSHGESNAAVVEQGFQAIWNLSFDDANKTKLGEAGACEGAWTVLRDVLLFLYVYMVLTAALWIVTNVC